MTAFEGITLSLKTLSQVLFMARDGNYARNCQSGRRTRLAVSRVLNRVIFVYTSSPQRLPTDIQSEAIPLILGGGDVLMAAETGSGKTGAFSLPILQIVWETINGNSSDIRIK